jgi:Baseplate J-like protein
MAEYVELDLIADSGALANVGFSYLEQAIDGWTARPANIETVLLEANAQIASEVVEQASQVPPAVYATIGETIYGIPRHPALAALATAVVTFAADTPPVMVDAQSQVMVPNPSGETQLFLTDTDIVAPQGGGQVTVGLTASEPGVAANGSFGIADLVTDVDGVDTIVVSTAQGGADEEDIDDYLDRLTSALTILAPRPILPQDHATLAQQVTDVGRVVAIDLYMPPADENPVGDTDAPEYDPAGKTGVPRCTTVAITGPAGVAPETGLKQRVFETLDAAREVNFLNYVIGPTYTYVGVRATVVCWPGIIPADAAAAAEAMMLTWLDPGAWGVLPGAGVTADWAMDTKARIFEAVDFLNRANGVFYVETVQLRGYAEGGTPGAWTDADVDLIGAAPLPLAGAIEITAIPLPPAHS